MNNFGPMTPNMRNQMNSNMNTNANLQQSFTPNRPLIDGPDYANRGNVLHNNLAEKLMAERVVEYRIQINSADRNVQMFPSPFDMKAAFGNVNYAPNIDRKFKNIKYVTLNSVIMPRTIAIDTSKAIPDSAPPNPKPTDYLNIYPTTSLIALPPLTPAIINTNNILNNLDQHPFLYLKIKELDSSNSLASSPILDRDTFMLIPDQKLGDMYLWKPRRSTVVFPNSLLTNLSQLSLLITDERGKKLSIYDYKGKNIIGQPLGTYINIDYNAYVDKYKNDNYYVDYTNNMTQVIYDFTFGVIENELNTTTSFS